MRLSIPLPCARVLVALLEPGGFSSFFRGFRVRGFAPAGGWFPRSDHGGFVCCLGSVRRVFVVPDKI